MADYIVLLKEEADSQAGSSGRRAIYERNQGRAAEFKRRLNEWLEEKGLQSQVTGIAEPGGFPLITLTSTPAVAEAIESFPEVESVVEDSDLIGFVPTVTGKRITRLAGRHGE